MTLVNERKLNDFYRKQLSSIEGSITTVIGLEGKPFYCDWPTSKEEDDTRPIRPITGNGACCFSHIVGLPSKYIQELGRDRPFPLFDYENMLYQRMQQYKHIWIKKATGLGVTEFVLRYMAWLCVSGRISGQMCIVTGPRIELSITLIDRLKRLFSGLNYSFDSKETVIELNGVHIEAYPSHHLDAMRGLTDVSFIYLDEADFFPPGQQQDARDVSERYIAKSSPWIVMVSTPNAPEQLFDRIEHEPESTCLYKRILLDYTYGLDKIYTPDEIANAKQSPSFEREYNLKYLGAIGNVFHTLDIERAIEKGKLVDPRVNSYTRKSMGLDPGFGSSNFGVCITELRDGGINVLHCEEYQRPDFNAMLDLTLRLMAQYQLSFIGNDRIFCDGANPEFITSLKSRLNEDTKYDQQISRWKSANGAINVNLDWLIDSMYIIPIQFKQEHRAMLAHAKSIVESNGRGLSINPKFNKLITSLRTAVEKGEGSLDKELTSFDDCFDAFRLSLMYWQRRHQHSQRRRR
jgi:hypothetical protein